MLRFICELARNLRSQAWLEKRRGELEGECGKEVLGRAIAAIQVLAVVVMQAPHLDKPAAGVR